MYLKKIPDLLLTKYYNLRYKIQKCYWDRCSKHSTLNGIALMFHNISDETLDAPPSCLHKVSEFRHAIEELLEQGYKFVSMDEFMDCITSGADYKFALVTFDDVPQNVYDNAFPILKEMRIPFVLFLTTGFVDAPGFLTKEQILEMDRSDLCTIGAHTCTHPMLRKCNNAKEELEQSKKTLEDLVGHSVDVLAYPFGRQSSVSHQVMRLAKDAGYRCAFGTIQCHLSDVSSKSRYYLPRIVLK